MYSGHSGEDLILTWSVSPLDSQRHSLLSWSHEWIHWRDSKASSWGKKKKKHHLYQGQKRWGALEKHKWRATQRYCFRQDDGRWEIQRTDLNLGSGILLDLWHASLMSQMVKTLPAMCETQVQSMGQEDPLEETWQPTPVFLPGESHGQRGRAGYSPWNREKSDKTVWLSLHFTPLV